MIKFIDILKDPFAITIVHKLWNPGIMCIPEINEILDNEYEDYESPNV